MATFAPHAEDELRRSEARLESGADLAGLAFYEVHFGEAKTYFDDPCEDLFGLPEDKRHGLQPLEWWAERLHPEDQTRVLDVTGRIKGPHGAAAKLGINSGTLYGRMRRLGIPLSRSTTEGS